MTTEQNLDQDLADLKKEMSEMSPEKAEELGLNDPIDTEEMASVAGEIEEDLTKRHETLAESLTALEGGDQVSEAQKGEVTDKLLEEMSQLTERAEQARDKKEFWKSTDSGAKKIAMIGLGVLTAGSVLKPLQMLARKGEIGLDAEDWARVGVVQAKFTKIVVKGVRIFTPKVPLMGTAEKIAGKNIELEERNLERAREGEGPVSFGEISKEYLDMLPKDFFKNSDNIKILGAIVKEAGGAVGGPAGDKIAKIGELAAENPEIAGKALEKTIVLAKEGKLELNKEEMAVITKLAVKEGLKRMENKPESKETAEDKIINLEDRRQETKKEEKQAEGVKDKELTKEELEKMSVDLNEKLALKIKAYDELQAEISEIQTTDKDAEEAINVIEDRAAAKLDRKGDKKRKRELLRQKIELTREKGRLVNEQSETREMISMLQNEVVDVTLEKEDRFLIKEELEAA